uniref:Uncharacterized protein n=1 Tax=Setaria italica TaxID=4555 RepID=K3Y227_SETIT
MAMVVAGGGDSIASSAAAATYVAATPSVPPMITPITGAVVPRGSNDPLHHTTMLTPPTSVPPGALITPDPNERFHLIEKTSKRVGYPTYAKVKEDKKGKQWYFDHVEEAHNHKLHPSLSMVRYMHAHKQREMAMDDLFAIMSRNGVVHQAAMNVMSELFGGRQNWPFTDKDVKNITKTKSEGEAGSLINYPLGPTQFEVEWKKLVDECGIADNPAIIALWEKRKSWIATYFKGMMVMLTIVQPCTCLQRGCLTRFSTQTTWMLAEVVRACKSRFDEQLIRVYTRAVYQEYKKQYGNSTTFVIEPNPDPEVRNGYLVTHEKGTGSFCWTQHAFRVSIPEKYILRRYTCDARSMVPWDRHDVVQVGPRGDMEQSWLSKLLPKLMRLGRAGSKTDCAYAKIAIGAIKNVGAAASTLECSVAVVEFNEPESKSNLDPTSINYLAGNLARKVNLLKRELWEQSVQTCNVTGHYSTTCPLNPNRSRATENRVKKRGAKTQGGTLRKRGRPKIQRGLNEEQEGRQSGEDEASGCVNYQENSDGNDYESE